MEPLLRPGNPALVVLNLARAAARCGGHLAVGGSFSYDEANRFLRMAWLANPFAYIAINTLIAVVPGVAHRLGLSTMFAGFCC